MTLSPKKSFRFHMLDQMSKDAIDQWIRTLSESSIHPIPSGEHEKLRGDLAECFLKDERARHHIMQHYIYKGGDIETPPLGKMH